MRVTGVALVLTLCACAPAAAQDRGSAFIGGSVSAANMAARTDIAFSGSAGFRVGRVVSFVIEATGVPKVTSDFPVASPVILSSSASSTAASVVIYPGRTFDNPGGRIVLFTNSARVDIPTTSSRVTPFFSAGGGVANIRRTADFTYQYPLPVLPPGTPPLPVVRPIVEHITSSSTELALTLGGGTGIRLARAVWLDVDLRLFRLLGEDDQNLGRFGVGVRYVF